MQLSGSEEWELNADGSLRRKKCTHHHISWTSDEVNIAGANEENALLFDVDELKMEVTGLEAIDETQSIRLKVSNRDNKYLGFSTRWTHDRIRGGHIKLVDEKDALLFVYDKNQVMRLASEENVLALDICHGDHSAGQDVLVWYAHSAINQQFVLNEDNTMSTKKEQDLVWGVNAGDGLILVSKDDDRALKIEMERHCDQAGDAAPAEVQE